MVVMRRLHGGRAWVAGVVALFTVLGVVPASAAGPRPGLAYLGGPGVRVASANGAVLQAYEGLPSPSLDRFTIVGEGSGAAGIGPQRAEGVVPPGGPFGGIVAYDAISGTLLWEVESARHPIALDRGRQAAFLPGSDGSRDPQQNSLWIRRRNGNVRKVVQFSNGGGLPGYDAGFEGDGTLLSVSFDAAAESVVLAEGNDVDLFIYDVFVVDVASRQVTRVTDDRKSRWPSMTPNGLRIAYQKDVRRCGAFYIRAAHLMTARPDGTHRRRVVAGSCDKWLHNPRWISSTLLVAYQTRQLGPGDYSTKLVLVDVTTGAVEPLARTANAEVFSVDPVKGLVGFGKAGKIYVVRLDGSLPKKIGNGYIPVMNGDHQTI